MTKKLCLAVGILLAWAPPTAAQFSGYSSVQYGFHQNPLYNYQKLSDQMKEAYLELSYLHELQNASWDMRYVGGLVTFNRFNDRNFYEHSLRGRYKVRLNSATRQAEIQPADNLPDTTETGAALAGAGKDSTSAEGESDGNESDSTDVSSPPCYRDSTDRFLDFAVTVAARHDKITYDDFDNYGGELASSYRLPLSEHVYVRLTNIFATRTYSKVTVLSNVNDMISAEIGLWSDSGFVCGGMGSLGGKYYTSSFYDTTLFESTRTFVQNPAGKGKPGGKALSQKEILVEPQANGTVQAVASLFARKDWSSQSSILSSVLYRWMLRPAVRYLAQRSNASLLTGDIYNDFFSYQGPEARLHITQALPAGVQCIFDGKVQLKRFNAPALTLTGETIGSNRKDLYSSAELYLSRYFELFGSVGFDLSLSATIARNQSNDSYNDFSLYAVSTSLGIGF